MTRADAPAIRLLGAGKRLGERWAVRDVDLEAAAGETLVLIGGSGSGKTTTLRLVNRLLDADAGRIEVLGRDVRERDPAELRRGIGYVIQEVGLFPHYTVRRNAGVVPELLGWERRRLAARVDELLRLVGLPPETYAERWPSQLSGGQRQRVGIARALAADPPIVLLDEPFSALDAITRESVQDAFLELRRTLKKTFVVVTHDVVEAVRLADRIAVLDDGRLVQVGTPAEVVRAPATPFVVELLGRHRHQLRLMTRRLGEAMPKARREPPHEARILEIDPTTSLWDALGRAEADGATWIRAGDGDGAACARIADLLASE